jgi:hypothetical protein
MIEFQPVSFHISVAKDMGQTASGSAKRLVGGIRNTFSPSTVNTPPSTDKSWINSSVHMLQDRKCGR